MGLILDTSILIDIEAKHNKTIEKLRKITSTYPKAYISFITYFEFLYGIMDKNNVSKQKLIKKIDQYRCLRASKYTSKILAKLKYKYDKKGISIPLPDLLIAAQSIEYDMVIFSRDKHFQKISEIKTL